VVILRVIKVYFVVILRVIKVYFVVVMRVIDGYKFILYCQCKNGDGLFWEAVQAFEPARKPVAKAICRLKPPVCESTSIISPAK
jgi:hypothetical protein